MTKGLKQKYISSAFLLLLSTVVIKVISAVYKIPLTNYIGATGRGYFSVAYNLYMPIHAITMGAFPIALTKLVSTYNAKGESNKILALKRASRKLFFLVGFVGLVIMLAAAKPYTSIVSSPNSIYTIIALAPCVFFSCLGASRRAYAEGFLDMKPTAVSQTVEALFKMVFGLLFARLSMNYFYNIYIQTGCVFNKVVSNEQEALLFIYPITSAFAMLGGTLGDFISYVFLVIYDKINYTSVCKDIVQVKQAYTKLIGFSCALVGATAIQSFSGFIDNSSIQYFLSLCNADVLGKQYAVSSQEVLSYVFGIYAVDLDFKNLIPSFVMALGITAVPAVSASYEGGQGDFSSLLTSIFKYTAILSVLGGVLMALFPSELLSVLYGKNNPDIVTNARELLFWFGVTALPCSFASTTVFCSQSLGFAKESIPSFIVSALARVGVNYLLITNNDINIIGTAFSNFIGFLIIMAWNMCIICKKTNAKIDLVKVLVKPVCCGVFTYFAVNFVKQNVFPFNNSIVFLVINVSFCLLLFITLQFLTKSITLSELKRLK